MWTAALTVTGLGGLWLVARHWQGWILYLINEVLWLAYGLTIHSTPVIVMAVLWFITGTRNLVVTRRSQHALAHSTDLQGVRPVVREDDESAIGRARLRILYGVDIAEPKPGEAERERHFWRPY